MIKKLFFRAFSRLEDAELLEKAGIKLNLILIFFTDPVNIFVFVSAYFFEYNGLSYETFGQILS